MTSTTAYRTRSPRDSGAQTHPGPAPTWELTEALISLDRREAVLWGIVAFGILLRLFQYLANPSLWINEAMLAHSLAGRSYWGLWKALDYEQAAPPLFLWLERFSVDLFGRGEMSLRLVPFLAGCSVMPLGLLVARRLLPQGAVAVALALLAISDPLIDHSVEVKPYTLDAAVSLLFLLCVLRVLQEGGQRTDLLLLGTFGILAPWISFPAVFVVPAGYIVLLGSCDPRRDRRRCCAIVVGMLLWLVSTLGLMMLVTRWHTTGALQEVWIRAGGFPPVPPRSWSEARWYARAAVRALEMPGGFTVRTVGLFLAVLGVADLLRRRLWASANLLCLPLLLAFGASVFRLYPFAHRLLLFAGPSLAFLVTFGLRCIWKARIGPATPGTRSRPWGYRLGRGLYLVAVVLALGLTVGVEGSRALYHVARPRVREQVREMAGHLRRSGRPGDLVYVYYAASPTFRFYVPQPPFRVRYGIKRRKHPELYRTDLDSLVGERRLWVLISHIYKQAGVNEHQFILQHLDRIGRLLESHPCTDGGLYLYDLSDARSQGAARE